MDSFGVLDAITIPLDDRFWQGGVPLFGGLDGNYKFATFSGSAMAATLQSYTATSPSNLLITKATPISDNANSTLQVGVRYRLSDAVTWKAPVGRQRSGIVPLRGSGLDIAFQENHNAGDDWSYANGIDYPGSASGGPV
jgi:hypothetical protein